MPVVLTSLILIASSWVLVCLVGHGYSNCIDYVAYVLHRHAERMRAMHKRREAVVRERWVRELENTVVDGLEERSTIDRPVH